MESVLLKANLVNLSTGQYWLKIDEEKGMSDREGHGHKAVLYKSHFPPLRHSFRQRHHCIHRLINHVYTQRPKHSFLSLPHDSDVACPSVGGHSLFNRGGGKGVLPILSWVARSGHPLYRTSCLRATPPPVNGHL